MATWPLARATRAPFWQTVSCPGHERSERGLGSGYNPRNRLQLCPSTQKSAPHGPKLHLIGRTRPEYADRHVSLMQLFGDLGLTMPDNNFWRDSSSRLTFE